MKDLREFLDTAIVQWRKALKDARLQKAGDDELVAMCYVDAYQCVRVSVIGSLLEDDTQS